VSGMVSTMRTDTYANVVLTVIFASACAAYGQTGRAPATASNGRPSGAHSGNTALPANADGQKAAQYLWDTILTKCGDSWVYGGSKLHLTNGSAEDILSSRIWKLRGEQPPQLLWEYKGVTFKLLPTSISPADALNGVTWIGQGTIRATAWRDRDQDGKWSEWKDSTYPNQPFRGFSEEGTVIIEKVSGKWLFSNVPAAELMPRAKPSCSALLP